MKPRWTLALMGVFPLLCGGLFSCMGLVQLVQPHPAQPREEVALFTGLFGVLPLLAGGSLMLFVLLDARAQRRRLQGLAWLRGRDRFTLAELAQETGLQATEARAHVQASLRDHPELDFVFHPSAGAYLRKSRVADGARVVSSCAGCGGRTELLLMPGEVQACPHCGAGL